MSDALDEQLAEYHDIKDWLAGTKPPPQGRTWRRRMQVQIQKALPQFARKGTYVLAPLAGMAMLRITVFVLLFNMGLPLLETFLSSSAPVSALPTEAGLSAMIETLRFWVNLGGMVGILLSAMSWVIAGE